MNSGKDVVFICELYGLIGCYYVIDWCMGVVVCIYGNLYKDDLVFFMVMDMISDFGILVFIYEMIYVNDCMVYLGGLRYCEGIDLEVFV